MALVFESFVDIFGSFVDSFARLYILARGGQRGWTFEDVLNPISGSQDQTVRFYQG